MIVGNFYKFIKIALRKDAIFPGILILYIVVDSVIDFFSVHRASSDSRDRSSRCEECLGPVYLESNLVLIIENN